MTPSPDYPLQQEPNAYILGTAAIELQRLELQDSLWCEVTEALWDSAGFGAGQNLMELGCGPGYSSLALARRVGQGGKVFAWDRSAQFLQFLIHRAQQQNLDNITAHQSDIVASLEPSLAGTFDGVFTRWLLCWMEQPELALQLAFEALRPGGKLVIFDYFHYHSLELLPQNPAFRVGIDAVEAAWRASGGNPSLGITLPKLVQQCGFDIELQQLCTRYATPEDPLWQWPTSFFPDFMPHLVADGFLDSAAAAAFLETFEQSKKHRQGLFLTPPMLELVAVKP